MNKCTECGKYAWFFERVLVEDKLYCESCYERLREEYGLNENEKVIKSIKRKGILIWIVIGLLIWNNIKLSKIEEMVIQNELRTRREIDRLMDSIWNLQREIDEVLKNETSLLENAVIEISMYL